MTDGIDPPPGPTQRGPWPQVTELDRIYDHGAPWCVNAAAHPDENGGYPDAERHLPWHECRGVEALVDDVRSNLGGDDLELSAYLACPFRFGQPRDSAAPRAGRVVIEAWRSGTDEPSQRMSMSAGTALRLARILVRLVDELTFANRPR